MPSRGMRSLQTGACSPYVGIAVLALGPYLCSAFKAVPASRWTELDVSKFACNPSLRVGSGMRREFCRSKGVERGSILQTQAMGVDGGGVELTKEEKFKKYQQLFKELMIKAQKLPPGSASKRAYMTKARNAKAMADALAYSQDKPEEKQDASTKPRQASNVVPVTAEMVKDLTNVINWAYRGEPGKDGKCGWTTEADILTGVRTTEEELYGVVARSTEGADEAFFAVVADGAPVGCIRVVKASETEAEIGMFAVAIDFQSKGLGRTLFDRAEEEARRMGARMAVLQVLTPRTDLMQWYRSLGYSPTGIKEELYESELWEVVGEESLFFERLERVL